MEWPLNIQQAVKSMQGVVGRLHYGGASVLHLFISFSFYFSTRLLDSFLSVAQFFFSLFFLSLLFFGFCFCFFLFHL